jgi:hypothetical protein
MTTNDEWITVHPHGKENEGQPLFIEEGESYAEAINRKYPKKENETKQQSFVYVIVSYYY